MSLFQDRNTFCLPSKTLVEHRALCPDHSRVLTDHPCWTRMGRCTLCEKQMLNSRHKTKGDIILSSRGFEFLGYLWKKRPYSQHSTLFIHHTASHWWKWLSSHSKSRPNLAHYPQIGSSVFHQTRCLIRGMFIFSMPRGFRCLGILLVMPGTICSILDGIRALPRRVLVCRPSALQCLLLFLLIVIVYGVSMPSIKSAYMEHRINCFPYRKGEFTWYFYLGPLASAEGSWRSPRIMSRQALLWWVEISREETGAEIDSRINIYHCQVLHQL
jgi:hypothetical protein